MQPKILTDQELLIEITTANGDLTNISPQGRHRYYELMCQKAGLDPFSLPFQFLSTNKKVKLYAGRECCQMLSAMHGISHTVTDRQIMVIGEDSIFMVTTRATIQETGRHSESIGAISLRGWNKTDSIYLPLHGEELANAMMKGETKSKRRATLDVIGLGLLDASEIGDIPDAELLSVEQMMEAGTDENSAAAAQNNGNTATSAQPAANTQQQQQQAQNAQETPFTKKYTEAGAIRGALALCNTVKEVAALYFANAQLVDGDENLKADMSAHRNLCAANNSKK